MQPQFFLLTGRNCFPAGQNFLPTPPPWVMPPLLVWVVEGPFGPMPPPPPPEAMGALGNARRSVCLLTRSSTWFANTKAAPAAPRTDAAAAQEEVFLVLIGTIEVKYQGYTEKCDKIQDERDHFSSHFISLLSLKNY